MIKRCPQCKGKVNFAALKEKFFCWECKTYYLRTELVEYHNYKELELSK